MNRSITKIPTVRRAGLDPMPCSHCGGTGFDPVAAVDHALVVESAPVEHVAGLPDAGPVRLLIGQALKVLFEAIDGLRPVEQLAKVATAPVVRHARAARACQRGGRVTRLRSVRICRPTEDIAEVAAVVGFDARVRAVAVRFERTSAGWRCTALTIL
jgi:hypothetical protein